MNLFKKTINENIELITDSNNKEIQIEEFIENRHDQSIMSIISKKIGTVSIKMKLILMKTQLINSNSLFLVLDIMVINLKIELSFI